MAWKAGIVLTVAELDPAIGAEHLSTWATQAVAVFTAGRTRAARAYAVGEMLRLSGIRAISGVIVGADKTDESLGSVPDDAAVLARLRVPEPVTPDSGHGEWRRRLTATGRRLTATGRRLTATGRGFALVSASTVAVRRPPRLAPLPAAAAAERAARRWVAATWFLLVLNVMTFFPKTWSGEPLIVPIPSAIGKLVTQGSLPLALLIALAVNRRKLIRPSMYLGLLSLLLVEVAISALEARHLGTTYRVVRLAMFIATLWLLTPWWGRKDLFLVKCHLWAMADRARPGVARVPHLPVAGTRRRQARRRLLADAAHPGRRVRRRHHGAGHRALALPPDVRPRHARWPARSRGSC